MAVVICDYSFILQGKNMDKQKSGKGQQRGPGFSGYNLFTEEFFAQKRQQGAGSKGQKLKEGYVVVTEEWNKLTQKKKEEYKKRAIKLRSPGKGRKYVVPFLTRSAPKQFMAVCKNLKGRPDIMKRLKQIGFDKLVNVSCPTINRELCAEFMRCFDTPTNQVSIRGKTCGVGAEDVSQLLGLPIGGREVQLKVDDGNGILKDLRSVYKNVKYQTIAEWLMGPADENFEFLFVVFALGTLLDPTASIVVSDRVLKLMTVTKDALGQFNWSSFIFEQLCLAVGEYQRELRKEKAQGRKTVGGCIYFFMMFCLQHFSLGNVKAPKDEGAIMFWNEKRVKARVQEEKTSKNGLLHGVRAVGGQSATPFDPETMLTHPEIKSTYARLVSMVGEELLALQNRLLAEEKVKDDDDNGAEEEEDDDEEDEDGQEKEGDDEDDEEEEGEKEITETVEAETDEEHAGPEGDKEGHDITTIQIEDIGGTDPEGKDEPQLQHGQKEKEGSEVHLRRSERVITPSWVVKSPWLAMTKKSKGKRQVERHDTLFQLCTSRCTQQEGDDEFVAMHHYFLTRGELYCLRPKGWISDRFMSMVAKTLVEDQKVNQGRVGRHIFTADFMHKIVASPMTWSVSAHETQLLPEHLGYNIGDCDFIFGPTLFHDHWFCYVVETKTMKFYALDSLVDIRTYTRKQKELQEPKPSTDPKKKTTKRRGQTDPKELLANRVRACFFQILRRVKPTLFADEDKISDEVTWAKVHVQADTDSCGVHVLSWLQMWDATVQGEDDYTMPLYSQDELHQLKVGVLWWLVTHPHNTHAEKVMSLMQEVQKRQRTH